MKIFPGPHLVAEPGVVYDFEVITGHLDMTKADEKTAFPHLLKTTWLPLAGVDASRAFPLLKSALKISVQGLATKVFFPSLTEILWDLQIADGDFSDTFPVLKKLAYLWAKQNSTSSFQSLVSMGSVQLEEGAEIDFSRAPLDASTIIKAAKAGGLGIDPGRLLAAQLSL